jgi:hypothetical protein
MPRLYDGAARWRFSAYAPPMPSNAEKAPTL